MQSLPILQEDSCDMNVTLERRDGTGRVECRRKSLHEVLAALSEVFLATTDCVLIWPLLSPSMCTLFGFIQFVCTLLEDV